jgi:nucleoside-diphosphate-sugar epimerase
MRKTIEYLILGGAEGVGYAFSHCLFQKGIPFTLLANSLAHVPGAFLESASVEVVEGDIGDQALLQSLAKDKRYIFLGNDCTWQDWQTKAIAVTRNVIQAAATKQSILIYPGRVGQFDGAHLITEKSPPRPSTSYATLEVKLEDMMLDAVIEQKCKVIIIRLPMLYGPGMSDANISAIFLNAIKKKANAYPVSPDIPRQFAYTKDVAEVIFRLLKEQRQDFFSVYNFGGQTFPSARYFMKLVHKVAGSNATISGLSKWRIKLLSIFSNSWKEMSKKMELFEQSFLLDDANTRQLLPDFKPTEPVEAISDTLQWLRHNDMKDRT